MHFNMTILNITNLSIIAIMTIHIVQWAEVLQNSLLLFLLV